MNAADQRHERTLRGRAKVSVNTVAIDPMRPHLFATGSSDPLGMLSLAHTHNIHGLHTKAYQRAKQLWGKAFGVDLLAYGMSCFPSALRLLSGLPFMPV